MYYPPLKTTAFTCLKFNLVKSVEPQRTAKATQQWLTWFASFVENLDYEETFVALAMTLQVLDLKP